MPPNLVRPCAAVKPIKCRARQSSNRKVANLSKTPLGCITQTATSLATVATTPAPMSPLPKPPTPPTGRLRPDKARRAWHGPSTGSSLGWRNNHRSFVPLIIPEAAARGAFTSTL